MAHPHSAFAHHPLGEGMIRLLRLKSRAHADHITCEIIHCDLDNDYDYLALSYAWAKDGKYASIQVDGCTFTISVHLNAALREVQLQDEDCVLWIDQICINQSDDKEKSIQVSKMQYIYAKAKYVIVWLGTASNDSDLLMTLFAVLGEKQRKKGSALNSRSVSIWKKVAKRLEIQFELLWYLNARTFRLPIAFDYFCNRNYWKRLWVIQEVAVAKDVLIRCGRDSVSYSDFHASWVCIDFMHNTHGHPPRADSIGEMIGLYMTAPARSFISGILACRELYHSADPTESLYNVMKLNLILESEDNQVQASDSRDRVFGLMGLCQDADDFKMFPDYSMKIAKVHQNLAQQFLKQGHIDNLSHCQSPFLRSRGGAPLPTWVPNWSMHVGVPMYSRNSTSATGTRAPSKPIFSLDLKRVTLEGVTVDYISELGSACVPDWLDVPKWANIPVSENPDISAALEYLRSLWRFRTLSPRFNETSSLLDLARFAIADQYGSQDKDFSSWLGVKWPKNLSTLKQDAQFEAEFYTLIDSKQYVESMKRLHGRRLFLSRSGWVGLAPMHIRKNDKIVIFLGGRAAYIIRDHDTSTYTLVGEAYVHGIMAGEFMTDDVHIERFELV